jgi:hypothetical protein
MEGFGSIDSGFSRHMTGDRRWFSSLTPVMIKEYITFGDNEKGRVLPVGTMKVTESMTLRCCYCQVFGVQSSSSVPTSS